MKINYTSKIFKIVVLYCLVFLPITLNAQQIGLHVDSVHQVLFGDKLTGKGTKLMWMPSKRAFRVGGVFDDAITFENESLYWDMDSIGIFSTAFGNSNKAKGISSMAWGINNQSIGQETTAWGFSNLVSGLTSTGWGRGNVVYGNYATAWGGLNILEGDHSTAWGESNSILGANSTAFGVHNSVSGDISTVWGQENEIAGELATAWGQGNKAQSYLETVLGNYADTLSQVDESSWQENDLLFSIGNGNSNNIRHSALTVLKNGNTGIGVTEPLAGLHVDTSLNVLFGDSLSGASTRFMWIADKGALRAGSLFEEIPISTFWDSDSIGVNSTAFGGNNIAKGPYSVAWGDYNSAIGESSTAWGKGNYADGKNATVLGESNNAEGKNSTVWGKNNTAKDSFSTIWGTINLAHAYSTVWGSYNLANGISSTIWGNFNSSDGELTTVWGENNNSQSYVETILGRYADTLTHANPTTWEANDLLFAIGNGSDYNNRKNAISLLKNGNTGIGVTEPLAGLHVDTSLNVLFGDSLSGTSKRFMWIAEKGALRAGEVINKTYWDPDSIGMRSTVFGLSNRATGVNAMTWGIFNNSSNQESTSWGELNSSIGENSTTWGYYNKASGHRTTAFGSFNLAAGTHSTVWGQENVIAGELATAWGQGNKAQSKLETTFGQFADTLTHANPTTWEANDLLFAIGNGSDYNNRNNAFSLLKNGNTGIGVTEPLAGLHVDTSLNVLFGDSLSGDGSRFMWIAEKGALRAGDLDADSKTNWDPDNIGKYSVAFGFNSKATGSASTAWAVGVASGTASTAWGEGTTASGVLATAWGEETKASGSYSTAWGFETTASGVFSTAWGHGNKAQSYQETVLGQFADTLTHANPLAWEANDILFTIGNGSDNNNRNNAISLLKNGNLGLNKTEPETLFDVEGTGGDIGGSSGFDEVTAHFKQTSPGHSAVSVDAIDSRDAIVYLAEDGRAYWDMRHDSDDDHQFQIRYQGPGAPNNVRMFMDTLGNMEIDGSLTQMSDRNQKEAFQEMDPQYILDKLQEIPVTEWQYKGDNKRHIGPMAQDFHAAFGLGKDETRISTIDMDGVNMAAIQALYDQNKKQEEEIEELKSEIEELKKLVMKKIDSDR